MSQSDQFNFSSATYRTPQTRHSSQSFVCRSRGGYISRETEGYTLKLYKATSEGRVHTHFLFCAPEASKRERSEAGRREAEEA